MQKCDRHISANKSNWLNSWFDADAQPLPFTFIQKEQKTEELDCVTVTFLHCFIKQRSCLWKNLHSSRVSLTLQHRKSAQSTSRSGKRKIEKVFSKSQRPWSKCISSSPSLSCATHEKVPFKVSQQGSPHTKGFRSQWLFKFNSGMNS